MLSHFSIHQGKELLFNVSLNLKNNLRSDGAKFGCIQQMEISGFSLHVKFAMQNYHYAQKSLFRPYSTDALSVCKVSQYFTKIITIPLSGNYV